MPSLPIINPSNQIKLAWDFVYLGCLLLCLYYVPICIVENLELNFLMPQILNYLLHIVLFIDIIISIRTGYYDKGSFVQDSHKIWRKYCDTMLIKDIFAQFPFQLYFFFEEAGFIKSHNWIRFLLLFFLLKIYHIFFLLKKLEENFLLRQIFHFFFE